MPDAIGEVSHKPMSL